MSDVEEKLALLMQSEWRRTTLSWLVLEVLDVHKQFEYGNTAEEPHSVICGFCHGKGVIDNILHEIIYDIQKMTFLKESEWGRTNLMRLLLEVIDVHKQFEYGNIAEEPHSVKCCLCHGRGVIANILHELISEIQWQVDIFHGGFTSREMSDHRSKGDQKFKCGAN